MHATHRSIRLRWSRKSTRIWARLALSPGVSHKTLTKQNQSNHKTKQNERTNKTKPNKIFINHERDPPQFERWWIRSPSLEENLREQPAHITPPCLLVMCLNMLAMSVNVL